MKVGGRRELDHPRPRGYGAKGSPPSIPPNEALVFVVDLLGHLDQGTAGDTGAASAAAQRRRINA